MTITSAKRRWLAVASGAVTTSAVAAALVLLAAPASAHTPSATPGCTKDGHATLTVVLAAYNPEHANHVKVMDGDKVLADTDFKSTFNFPQDVTDAPTLAGDVAHHFVVDVKAWDDPTGAKHFSWHWAEDTKACVKKTRTTPTTTTTTTTTHDQTAPTTTTTPLAVGANANLASTGASIGVPLA